MDKTVKKLTPLTEASFYVLLALNTPNHGYGVIKKVEELTSERLTLAAGTLYGIINTFLKFHLISLLEESGTRSKKTYQITPLGKELLGYEVQRLDELVRNAKEVLL